MTILKKLTKRLLAYTTGAYKIAALYLGFSLFWIFFSDNILLLLINDLETFNKLQTIKGWFFVTITTFIIFMLINNEYGNNNKNNDNELNKQNPVFLKWNLILIFIIVAFMVVAYMVATNFFLLKYSPQSNIPVLSVITGFFIVMLLLMLGNYIIKSKKTLQLTFNKLIAQNNIIKKNQKLLADTSKLGKLGSWEFFYNNDVFNASDEFLLIFGLTQGEVLHNIKNIHKHIHPNDIDFFISRMKLAADLKKGHTFTFRIIDKKNNLKYLKIQWGFDIDNNNNIIRQYGYIQDITDSILKETEIKKQQKLIKEQNKRFTQLFENMTSGFAVHKVIYNENNKAVDYMFIEVNPAFEKLTGLKASDIIGKTVKQVMPDTEDYWIEQSAKVAETGVSIEFKNYAKALGLYYDTYIFCPQKGQFATVFNDATQRENALIALKKSEERFNLAMQATQDGIWDWDIITKEVYFSPQLKKMIGYQPNELPSKYESWENSLHPDDKNKTVNNLMDCITTGKNYFEAEFRLKHKQGQFIDILSRALILYDNNGYAARLIGTHYDLTERKQNEYLLKKKNEQYEELNNELLKTNKKLTTALAEAAASEEKFRKIFELAPVSMIMFNFNNELLLTNIEFSKVFGYKFKHDISTIDQWWEKAYPDVKLQKIAKDNWDNNIINNKKFTKLTGVTYKVTCADMSIKDVEFTTVRIGDIGIVMLNDITNQLLYNKKIEQGKAELEELVKKRTFELIEREARLSHLINGIGQEFLFFKETVHGVITFATKATKHFFNMPPNQIIGNKWHDFGLSLTPESYSELKLYNNYTLNGQNKDAIELIFNRPDGKTMYTELTQWPEFNNNAQVIGIFGVVKDISKNKLIEKYLLQTRDAAETASRAKSEFISNMSHELRTPLNAILGYAQILKKEPNLTQKQVNNLNTIHQSGQHLLDLINDILDFGKIEADKITPGYSHFSLSDTLNSVIDIIKVKAYQKNLTINYKNTTPVNYIINSDQRRIKQILINLLDNAVKYTKKGGVELVVELNQNTKILNLIVSDTGIGIHPDKQQSVFEPFTQLLDYSKFVEGSGLGLPITKKIVQMLKGTLTLNSNFNKGSVFTVTIPVEIISKTTPNNSTAQQKQISNNNASIIAPANQILNQIIELAKIGDFIEIEKIITNLKTDNANYETFAATLEIHLSAYNDDAIIQLCKKLLT